MAHQYRHFEIDLQSYKTFTILVESLVTLYIYFRRQAADTTNIALKIM